MAEGFGAESIGGEGGRVIWVTNLNDGGPGSFREAVMESGPRIVKFKVGGIIPMSKPIRVTQGRLTIDGASAADKGGITLTGNALVFETLECRDVIVRHIRVRGPGKTDSICIGDGAHRVLIDHCSVSWAGDENFGINKGHYVTVQWSIIADGSTEEGSPGYGMLVAHGANHVTIHHNFWSGNRSRNALLYSVGGYGEGGAMPGMYPGERHAQYMPTAIFDFRNNLVYNFGGGTDLASGLHANVVGNYYRYGPREGGAPVTLQLRVFYPGSEVPKLFCKGNIAPQRPTDEGEEWALVRVDDKVYGPVPEYRSDHAFLVPPVKTHSAEEIVELILREAGAFPRDEVDQRLIDEYRAGTGTMGLGLSEWKKEHGL